MRPSVPQGSTPQAVVLEIRGDAAAQIAADDKTVISHLPPASEAAPPALISPQHIAQALVGKKLEHYELVEFVGGGGMGAVFRATDSRLGRTVAVKVLSRDQTDEETIRRFRNEAQSAARLDHPNIARVYYVGEDHGWNFIVFEFIEGVNLRDIVDAKGPLALVESLSYTMQVALALAHSSSRDVVHRDIKPSNVLVTADKTVKLVDMGLARLHQVESSSHDLTASGVTLGTFDYISPEQARDPRSADVRSDIYSLGCTLYYMLTCRPPFPDGTALQKLLRHNADEPPDVRHSRPELSPLVSALLAKMLAKRPSQRHQSAQELASDIAALADQLGLSGVAQGQVVVASRPSVGQFWSTALQVAVAAAVLVVGIFAVDAWLLRSPGESSFVMRPKLAPLIPAPADQPAIGRPGVSHGAPTMTVGPPPDRLPAAAASNPRPGANVELAATTPTGSAGALPAAPTAGEADSALAGLGPPGELDVVAAIGPPPITGEVVLRPSDSLATALQAPPATAPSAAAKIKRLVVSLQPPAELPPATEYVSSVAAACARAAELGLSEIDVAWSEPLLESPLEIMHADLTLRAVAGYRPTIVFRPEVSDAEARRQMIRLSGPGGRLSIQGIDLRLELPPEPALGWALLAMRPSQHLELSNCVLTVQDGNESRPPAHQQVAMILVQSRMTTDTMSMEPSATMAASTGILLSGIIARGEATFVTLAEDTPLSLNWSQGLLITPERLLSTSGSATSPKSFDRIHVKLDNVTAACSQGLHLMHRRRGAGYQFGLDVEARKCIFMTDVESPLYDFLGVSEVTQSDLQCDGEDNFYPQRPDVAFLRVRSSLPGEQETIYDLNHRGPWSRESQPLPLEKFRMSPPADRPAHDQTTESYAPPPNAEIEAGFDPDRVPSIQRAPADSPASGPATGPAPASNSLPDEPSTLGAEPAEALP